MRAFFNEKDIDLSVLAEVCRQSIELEDYPHAACVEQNVLFYDGDVLREAMASPASDQVLQAEFNQCLSDGPGVFVVTKAYPEAGLVDAVTELFLAIIQDEKAGGMGQGDHFGSNERIWNSFQKVAMRAPELFIAYYGNPILALASRAWLGPFYQITAQVNNVKPGSQAQSPHRDYHLGFQSDEVVAQFPARTQVMSQYLTLQGAIAHTDMPLASGPTLFLPFSQQFPAGYMAYRRPEFVAYFDEHNVQFPLAKGDAVFFSPALFHGAGTNQAKTDRLANLVQISSAFGQTMETIDHEAIIKSVYPTLLQQVQTSEVSGQLLKDVIAAVAEGYSFPTNLDSDAPIGGHAPATQQQVIARALEEGWTLAILQKELEAYNSRRRA